MAHRLRLAGWTGIAVLAVASTAMGHQLIAVGEAFPSAAEALHLEGVDVSQVAYADLASGARRLWLTFEADAPCTLHVSLGVPVLERLRGFRPVLAVLGEGLAPVALPVPVPEGYGGVVLPTAGIATPEPFHEPFTRTDSWILLDVDVELPSAGRHYIVAYPEGEEEGKLWVAVGTRERFGIRDLLAFPSVTREVRLFHEQVHRPLARTWEALIVASIFGLALSVLVFLIGQ